MKHGCWRIWRRDRPCSISGGADQRRLRAAAGTPRLSEPAGRGDRRPRARRYRVRRQQARRRLRPRAAAATRVHGLGGMMVGKSDIAPLLRPFARGAISSMPSGLLARHALDRLRFKRGTRLIMGNALVGRLLLTCRDSSVDIRYRTALKELIKIGDEIIGAVLTTPAGEVAIRAARAWCWRPAGSAGASNFASGCCRRTRGVTRCLPSPTRATASWPASALPARSTPTRTARRCGCRAR